MSFNVPSIESLVEDLLGETVKLNLYYVEGNLTEPIAYYGTLQSCCNVYKIGTLVDVKVPGKKLFSLIKARDIQLASNKRIVLTEKNYS